MLQKGAVLLVSVVLLCAVGITPLRAQWAVEAMLGTAVSANSPLTIRQDGYPPLHIDARWETRPFEPTIYYAIRVSRWWGKTGIFVDNLHHKLYLADPTADVQDFRITHGYNLFAVGPAFRRGEWAVTLGAGPVVTSPASTVRGRRRDYGGGILSTEYFVDGFHVQTGLNRRLHLSHTAFITADLRLSAGWAEVNVADGKAEVPNYAVHFLLGMGLGHRRK